jgi:hypothetical protein
MMNKKSGILGIAMALFWLGLNLQSVSVTHAWEILRYSSSAQVREAFGMEGLNAFMEETGVELDLYVGSSSSAVRCLMNSEPLDLIILDPDLHDAEEERMLQNLLDRIPAIHLVIHTYPSDYGSSSKYRDGIFFVEKKGNSVEHLKRVVYERLVEYPPRRQQA